jgi:hypothetical protein
MFQGASAGKSSRAGRRSQPRPAIQAAAPMVNGWLTIVTPVPDAARLRILIYRMFNSTLLPFRP